MGWNNCDLPPDVRHDAMGTASFHSIRIERATGFVVVLWRLYSLQQDNRLLPIIIWNATIKYCVICLSLHWLICCEQPRVEKTRWRLRAFDRKKLGLKGNTDIKKINVSKLANDFSSHHKTR